MTKYEINLFILKVGAHIDNKKVRIHHIIQSRDIT